jgi:hypothetical protein
MSTRALFVVVLCLVTAIAMSVRWYLAGEEQSYAVQPIDSRSEPEQRVSLPASGWHWSAMRWGDAVRGAGSVREPRASDASGATLAPADLGAACSAPSEAPEDPHSALREPGIGLGGSTSSACAPGTESEPRL